MEIDRQQALNLLLIYMCYKNKMLLDENNKLLIENCKLRCENAQLKNSIYEKLYDDLDKL